MTERADYEAMVEDVEWGLLPDRTGIALHALLTRLASAEDMIVKSAPDGTTRPDLAPPGYDRAQDAPPADTRASTPPLATGPSEVAIERAMMAYIQSKHPGCRDMGASVGDLAAMRAALIAAADDGGGAGE